MAGSKRKRGPRKAGRAPAAAKGAVKGGSRRRLTGWAVVGGLVLGGLILVLWRGEEGDAPAPPGPPGPEQLALGARLYDDYCAACHGANREGQPNWRQRRADGRLPAPPQDGTGHTWHHADDHLFRVTKYGIAAVAPAGYQTDMTGFGELLSDAEIWAILAFIKSRWPPQIQVRQAEISRRAD